MQSGRERTSASLARRAAGLMTAAMTMCGALALPHRAVAQESWAQHVIFENSISPTAYFYSSGKAVPPSTLEMVGNKLPVESAHFVSGPNALKLHYASRANGEWAAELRLATWPNRPLRMDGDTLSLWLYSETPLHAGELPMIALRDATNGFTAQVALGDTVNHLEAGKWTRVLIPLSRFQSVSVHPFDPARVNTVIFAQPSGDSGEHTLLLDDVRIEDAAREHRPAPPAPQGLTARGYGRHVELAWTPLPVAQVDQYVVYRSVNNEPFRAIGVQRPGVRRYEDFVGDDHFRARYRATARTAAMAESAPSATVEASTHPLSDDELLSMIEEASFHYYWDGAEPHSGLALESKPGGDDIVAVGGSGFGIMSMIVASERGFEPRDAIVDRMLHITSYLAHADRFHGVWPHFLSGSTGHVLRVFGMYDDGADLVETSFLMQGLLAARGYFTRDTPKERQLRQEITALWEGVDWDWFRATPNKDALYWHWSPDWGFYIANRLQGWNETMITYMLAIASPTHPAPASIYYSGFAAEGNPSHPFGKAATYYGLPLAMNYSNGFAGPLFFTHYSFMGYDPRGVRDKYADYFVNNRNESLIQQKYAIENPHHFKGYGADEWGFSAVTGPRGYREYRAGPEDDGTIAPTAAGGAYAYTPAESLLALKHFYNDLGAKVWDVYGFRNAFNETEDWYSPDELGLNQGPQAVMIENGRTGLVWKSFMANPEMRTMQKKIGLTPTDTPPKH